MHRRAQTLSIILLAIIILAYIPGLVSSGEYGEDSTSLGQFVDDYENLDNVSVIDDVVRNATLNAIELDGTEYTEFIQDPVQLREHDTYVGFDPNVYWTLGLNDLREYTTNNPRGDGWMFINCDAQWLEGKYIRIRWFTVGTLNNRPMYFRVYDGSYNRSSMTDFPTDNPILLKGNGLLYEFRESAYNSWVTRDFLMDLDAWSHELDTVMVAVYLWDNYQWYTRAYWDWIEWNEVAGGVDNIFTIAFTSATMNEVQEQVATPNDYGYINNTGLPLTGGGYIENGYFTTVDYLSDPLTNGSALVHLTNTTIPDGTTITVEFSEDNSSWTLNDWQPIFGGFEAIDLRELNYSSGFYIRYNFTGLITDTPRIYQSRLISTMGASVGPGANVTVYQNVTGAWVDYNVSQILNITGIHDGGTLASVHDVDGDSWNCSEVVGAPGYVLSFNFTGVDSDAGCLWLSMYVYYDGNQAHDIDVELWNFTSTSWIDLGHIDDDVAFGWHNFTVYGLRMPNDFVNSSGAVLGRLNHVSAGNINHDIFIDYLKLQAFIPFEEECPPVDEAPPVDDYSIIFLAIGLIFMLAIYFLYTRNK